MVTTILLPKAKAPNNIGTRIFGGRMGTFDNSTQKTFQFSLDTEQKADAVRFLFANGNTGATYAIGSAKAVGKANWSAPNISSGTLTTVTFAGGSAGGTVPVSPGSSRRGFLWSDWITLPHVTRDDGQAGSIITVAGYISSSATITILGNGTDNFTNWASKTSRKVMMRYNDGDCVTTPANFTSTTNRSQSPIIGVQYVARGIVRTVMGGGDSISEGRGTYLNGSFIYDACCEISDPSEVAVEFANVAVSGTSSATYSQIFYEALTALDGYLPDAVIVPNYSPNDGTSTPTQATVDTGAARGLRMAMDASRRGVIPVVWTGLPTNPALYDIGAADSYRVAKNLETMTDWADRGIEVIDTSTPMSGAIDGDGQYPFGSGLTTDDIHPNDAGNVVMQAVLVPKLRDVLGIAA